MRLPREAGVRQQDILLAVMMRCVIGIRRAPSEAGRTNGFGQPPSAQVRRSYGQRFRKFLRGVYVIVA